MIANILVLALPVFGLLIIIIHLIAFDVNRLSRDILEAECMWPRVGWTGFHTNAVVKLDLKKPEERRKWIERSKFHHIAAGLDKEDGKKLINY